MNVRDMKGSKERDGRERDEDAMIVVCREEKIRRKGIIRGK